MQEKGQVENWWQIPLQEVVSHFQTNLEGGLSQDRLTQSRVQYGYNELPEAKALSIWKIILSQFSNVIIWLLLAAIIVAAFFGEWIDSIAIAVIVILNGALGFLQEFKAEKSLAALRKMTEPKAKVIREGKMAIIPSRELVPGDIVLLEDGDHIPADGRVFASFSIATQEAALTGESQSVDKEERALPNVGNEISEMKNTLFMGTSIVRGRGKMIVTSIGLNTELGKIAAYLSEEKKTEPTPLQKKLNTLGNRLTWMCLAIIFMVLGGSLLRGFSFAESLLIGISLAVAAIPEGLPAVVTIALALGVRRMSDHHALVRRLPSVETLGCTTVICTDKTGTLTQNVMSVSKIWSEAGDDYQWILTIGTLCNNANLNQENAQGDPTEVALLVAAKELGLEKAQLEKEYILQAESPFDSEKKFMSVLRKKEERDYLFVKGALDVLLERSTTILIHGQEIPLTAEKRATIVQINEKWAAGALRVLAFAYGIAEEALVFVGMIGLLDPPRPEVKEAIASCQTAGIKIVMITGDHPITALAIGRDLNLVKEGDDLLMGRELEQISEEELTKRIRHITIYARTSAILKTKIVSAWKKTGEIIAMTGDGVNDAPAIKEADIGLSMGLKGTDVAREASDMVILDDNFATIVEAVKEGRGIYDNILKFVSYLLSCNIAELLIIFVSILFNMKDAEGAPFVALTALQLLWLNLVTDGLPAIALSMDPVDPQVMQRPPRRPESPILSLPLFAHLFCISLLIAGSGLVCSLYGLQTSRSLAYTMTFTILVVLELVRVQMVRAQYHMKLFSNPFVWFALASSFLLQLAVIYLPFLQRIFKTTPLGLTDWGIILGLSIAVYFLSAIVNKLFSNEKFTKN